jgi:membrane associated rhomboid family serine protease
MLIIPYKADVPVDHRPWGTIGIIAFTLCFTILLGFPTAGGEAFVDSLVLRFGTLNPLQWVTSVFVHVNWPHVLFNMLSLWWFGLAVEGLIGWRRLVPLYLAIGAAAGCVTQVLMIGADGGGAAGASGAIYGLMVVAALWASRNTYSTFIWIVVFIWWTDLSILTLAGTFVGLELFGAFLRGFSMSTEVLHLLGAGAGLGAGLWMLKNRLVDTGGWDWISLRKGRPTTIVAGPGPAPKAEESGADALATIRSALDNGNAIAADAHYVAARNADPSFALPKDDLLRLVEALARSSAPETAIERMEEYVATYPEAPVRLTLARLLVRARRPSRALEHLAALEPATDGQREAKAALEAEARAALGTSGLELE